MFRDDLSAPFVRIMGCTAGELRDWLEPSLPGAHLTTSAGDGDGQCRAQFADGELQIDWTTLEPRRIALLTIPQLQVRFHYTGLAPERRQEIQSHFDRATQRGGG
jgi:hypothetical protein